MRRLEVGAADLAARDVGMTASTTRLRWQSNRPLIRCRLPGPQLGADRELAGEMASAPAAKAAASSWRMWIQSIFFCLRSESVKPFSESPTTP